MDEQNFNERQIQALKFLENSIGRCYQEKLTSIDVLTYFLRFLSAVLEKDGLKVMIDTIKKESDEERADSGNQELGVES